MFSLLFLADTSIFSTVWLDLDGAASSYNKALQHNRHLSSVLFDWILMVLHHMARLCSTTDIYLQYCLTGSWWCCIIWQGFAAQQLMWVYFISLTAEEKKESHNLISSNFSKQFERLNKLHLSHREKREKNH